MDRRGLDWSRPFPRPSDRWRPGGTGQGLLVDVLFWVTLAIAAGALIGNWLGIMGYINNGWFWFGNQGLSYIQLGRFWQIGFFLGSGDSSSNALPMRLWARPSSVSVAKRISPKAV